LEEDQVAEVVCSNRRHLGDLGTKRLEFTDSEVLTAGHRLRPPVPDSVFFVWVKGGGRRKGRAQKAMQKKKSHHPSGLSNSPH